MLTHQSYSFSPNPLLDLYQLPIKKCIDDNIGFVELLEVFGSDLTVVNAARVSFHKESFFEVAEENSSLLQLAEKDKALIAYLAHHRHIAPFFHPQLRFRIKMPIFVAREWYRHTIGFARNEMSRRYVTDAPEFFIPTHLRKKDKNIKQGSSAEIVSNNDALIEKMKNLAALSLELYFALIEQGVCPEQARTVLLQSMYTEFIETASLAGYARLAILRLDPTAQKEIRCYAQLISTMVEQFFPVSWKALIETEKV